MAEWVLPRRLGLEERGFSYTRSVRWHRLSDPSATQVATPIEHILSDGIGQVEIIRGPQGLNFELTPEVSLHFPPKPTKRD